MSIRSLVKNNSFLSSLFYIFRKNKYSFMGKKYSKAGIDSECILFNHFNGKGFGDNPRAIAEKMHEMDTGYRLIWACAGKKEADSLPDYMEPVQFESEDYFRMLSTCGTWVFNVNMPDGVKKRPGQRYIQTWHGDRGFKKFADDALENDSYRRKKGARKIIENEICDYIVCGSTFAENVYRSALGYQGQYLKFGCPRNDCLLRIDEEERRKIRMALGLSDQVKAAIYAPTFRDHTSGQATAESTIDLSQILEALEKKDGQPWVLLKRAHYETGVLSQKSIENRIIDVTQYPDMADLLMIADFLITDYSSCASDFALTGKPVLLYQDDYEDFTRRDRSLYFTMESSPYLVAHNMEEALRMIRNMSAEDAANNDKQILDFYGAYESGRSAQKICELITGKA